MDPVDFDNKAYSIEQELYSTNKELRTQKRDVSAIQDQLGQLDFKIQQNNKTTQMIVLDSILDLHKNMQRFVKNEEK